MKRPKSSRLEATKRDLRYIKDTIDSSIIILIVGYKRSYKLHQYPNSNWYGDINDIKSITYCILLVGGTLIS